MDNDNSRSWFHVKQQRDLKPVSVRKECLHEEEEEPMSPQGAVFRHIYMDSYILVIIGLDKQVHVPSMKATLQSTLIKHKRFCSVVKRCKNGHQKWIRKDIDIDKHVIVPNLSVSYSQGPDFVENYTASLATAPPLDPSLPLWQIHALNYKSAEAESSVVLKIHHCLGDCISLMSLFLDCTNCFYQSESLPTIQGINRTRRRKFSPWDDVVGILKATWGVIFPAWRTVVDLVQALAMLLWMKDSKILRGRSGVIHQPKALAHVTVDLKDIAIVKNAIDGTVNDVVTGMLCAGFVRYFDRLHGKDGSSSKEASDLRIRALVPVNIRPSPGLHKVEYMIENPQKARWGNEFGLWILPFRLQKQREDNFLEYCRVAKAKLNKKKASYAARFTSLLVLLLSRVFGVNTAMYLPYTACLNTTLVFSNVLGPVEPVQFLDNPVTHIVTTVSGLPQGLVVHFQSYAGKAKLIAMATEDMFPQPHQLCMDCAHALDLMKKQALVLSVSK